MDKPKSTIDFAPPYTYRVYGAETVVYDSNSKRVVSCPTEQEAIEYLQELCDSEEYEKK